MMHQLPVQSESPRMTFNDVRSRLTLSSAAFPGMLFCTPNHRYLRVDRFTWLEHLKNRAHAYGVTWWAEELE